MFSEEEDALLLDVKARVEDVFEEGKWVMIAKQMGKPGRGFSVSPASSRGHCGVTRSEIADERNRPRA